MYTCVLCHWFSVCFSKLKIKGEIQIRIYYCLLWGYELGERWGLVSIYCGLGFEVCAMHMLSKCSITQLYSMPSSYSFASFLILVLTARFIKEIVKASRGVYHSLILKKDIKYICVKRTILNISHCANYSCCFQKIKICFSLSSAFLISVFFF